MCAPQSSPSNQVATGISAAPVCTARAAVEAIRAFSPNISTSIPVSFRSRSLTRQTRPPARSRWARIPNGLRPPVSGRTSIPRLSRNRTNASYTDSGRSRSATVVNEPAPRATTQAPACSKLPMCGSAMTTPRPAFRLANRACSPAGSMCIPDTIRSTGMAGSRNTSSQYRAYERSAARDRVRSSLPSTSGLALEKASTRRRLPSSTWTFGPCRRQAMSATAVKAHLAHDSGRRQMSFQPSRYANPVSRSLSPAELATPSSLLTLLTRRALSYPAGSHRSPGGPVDRVYPLPERKGASRRERPEPHVENVRHAEAGNADRDQRDEHALGPLDQAHVAAQPEALGPGLGIGHQYPRDQAEQRHPAEQRVVTAAEEPDHQAAEDAGVGDPVHGRVEERTPGPAGALDPGQHAVQHVQEHEDRAGQSAREQLADREQAERAARHAHRADDRDRVRRDRSTRQDRADRSENARHDGP